MRRREFVQLAAMGTAGMVVGCGKRGDERDLNAPKALLGRRELQRFDGLTSMHEHVDSQRGAEILLAAMAEAGIGRTLLLGSYETLLHGSARADLDSAARNNALLLELVAKHPGELAMFALMDGREEDPVATLRGYLEKGARGVKMYNGVATPYRAMPFTAAPLIPLYRFCELHGVPILAHVDGPHLKEFLEVVRDYPSIPWICPHLFVKTKPGSLSELERLLTRFPNVCTDMSFGFESWMHANLTLISQSRDRLREVFIRHADQIMFGTDIVVATNSPHRTVNWAANSFKEYRELLEFDGFHHRVKAAHKTYEADLLGLALPDDVLKKIYVENAKRFLDAPRPRFDRDDLHTVASALPEGAKIGHGSDALLAVAAVSVLSPLDDLPASVVGDGLRIVTPFHLADALSKTLGVSPDAIERFADVESVKDLVAREERTVGIIAFDDLDPRLRALAVAGVDPCSRLVSRCAKAKEATRHACFGDYPLLIPLSCASGLRGAEFDPHELRTVVMTGGSLPGKGMTDDPTVLPSEAVAGIAPLLRDADIAHISIENTIAAECVQDLKRWKFCYDPQWLDVLDMLGIDVIELTGNHLRDFGAGATSKTIAEYDERGLPHFGGGMNLADALRPAVVRIRGTRFGFIGLNRLNGPGSSASEDKAGPLTESVEGNFRASLENARRMSDAFVFTYQGGYEFSPRPWYDMVRYSHAAIESGAAGAFGVHAHMPAGAEVYKGALVSYGLGNFLFRHPPTEIPHSETTERAIVCRLAFYGKRLLSASLIPIEMEGGRISPSFGARAERTLARVASGSEEGLAPQRDLPAFADARLDIDLAKNIDGAMVVQLKLGLSGQLLSLSEAAAREAATPDAALKSLVEGIRKTNNWRLPGIKIAVPLLNSQAPVRAKCDAVRVFLSGDSHGDLETIQLAARAGVPVQLAGAVKVADLEARLPKSSEVPLVAQGLPMLVDEADELRALMRRHTYLNLDTSGRSPADSARFFDDLSGRPDFWRAFFGEFRERILLASCGFNKNSRVGELQAHVLRGMRCALEKDRFYAPLLGRGKQAEWSGYPYEEEPLRPGLALSAPVLDAIVGGNFHRLFGA